MRVEVQQRPLLTKTRQGACYLYGSSVVIQKMSTRGHNNPLNFITKDKLGCVMGA